MCWAQDQLAIYFCTQFSFIDYTMYLLIDFHHFILEQPVIYSLNLQRVHVL